jgi:hypothetical protein
MNDQAAMRQAAGSKRAETPANHLEEPWRGLRRQLRIRNILLVIVAMEAIGCTALRWWAIT